MPVKIDVFICLPTGLGGRQAPFSNLPIYLENIKLFQKHVKGIVDPPAKRRNLPVLKKIIV